MISNNIKNNIIDAFLFLIMAIIPIIFYLYIGFHKSDDELKCNKNGYEYMHGKCWKEVK